MRIYTYVDPFAPDTLVTSPLPFDPSELDPFEGIEEVLAKHAAAIARSDYVTIPVIICNDDVDLDDPDIEIIDVDDIGNVVIEPPRRLSALPRSTARRVSKRRQIDRNTARRASKRATNSQTFKLKR